MGLRDWLDSQAAATKAASAALLAQATHRAEASAEAARTEEAKLIAEANAMRVSNGGLVPDDLIDSQLAAYRRAVNNTLG